MNKKSTRPKEAKSNVSCNSASGTDLSVIIPAYNLENCLANCLNSILKQEIKNIEIIVVDNCSTDNTKSVIQKFAQKYKEIVPIFSSEGQVNNGPSWARNVALNIAKGKYIHFCDGDDLIPSGAYKELIQIAEEQNADLVTGNYSRMYPDENNAIRQYTYYSAPTGKERCFESGNTMLWNKIYRRSLLEKNHLRFDEEIIIYEDYLFFSKVLLSNPRVAYTDESIYIYTEPSTRPMDGTIRYSTLDSAKGFDRAWRTVFSYDISEEDILLWQEAYHHNLRWYFDWCWKMMQDPEERKQAFEIMRNLICWVEIKSFICSWLLPNYSQLFIDIFHVDYPAFCGIRYEDYLIQLALQDNIRPIVPVPSIQAVIRDLESSKRDAYLASEIRKQLVELREICAVNHINRRIWKNHYWNLIDSLINDYWRQISSENLKKEFFNDIREFVESMRKMNYLYAFSTPDDIWRFRQIFCVDNATLQIITLSEYLLICSPRYIGGAVGSSSQAPETIGAFISACRNGQVGMRSILKAVKSWAGYKMKRKR